jgi:Na+/H+ antiporter NhaD/arsenite permease-like protein
MQFSSGDFATKWKRMLWKSCVYLVTIGMLIAFFLGLNMSWTALTAALALVVLDFKDAQPCFEKVNSTIIVLFFLHVINGFVHVDVLKSL